MSHVPISAAPSHFLVLSHPVFDSSEPAAASAPALVYTNPTMICLFAQARVVFHTRVPFQPSRGLTRPAARTGLFGNVKRLTS